MSRPFTEDIEGVLEQSERPRLQDTQPRDETRKRSMEFDQPGEEELEAAGGGEEVNVISGVEELPDLRPEQQIRDEEEIRTPPRRVSQEMEDQQPGRPQDKGDGVGSVPGYVVGQRMYPADRNRPLNEWSPVQKLEGTVSRIQRDMKNLQTENRFLRTQRTTGLVPLVRQAALTTTKVPWFSGSTSWEQYQQVFDAIALSNGWGDATAALQLLSHLQGDALSVALLIPMPRRASRKELTAALSSHYGSPGRLATYRRQFDGTVRKLGEDPANFGITLETLAVKAFGDIGQTARLRLIRDRFIAGHESCELRRHLDCLPPDTPLRDIVDRCRVWESHSDSLARNVNQPKITYPAYVVKPVDKEPETVRAGTVNKPERSVEDTNALLSKLVEMLGLGVNTMTKAPEPSILGKIADLLRDKMAAMKPALPETQELDKLGSKLQTFQNSDRMPRQEFRQRPVQRDWSEVMCFSCGKSGHSATRCPKLDITFPFLLPGWRAEKTSVGYMMISPRRAMDRRPSENAN